MLLTRGGEHGEQKRRRHDDVDTCPLDCIHQHVAEATSAGEHLYFDLWGSGSEAGTPSDNAARCNSVGTAEFQT
jgi:hypothetical protein